MKLTMVAGFSVSDQSAEDLEQFLDRVMEELLALYNVEDSTLTAAAGAATPDWPTFHDLSIGTDLVGADQ
jgi:hypothetical protein